jgi:protein involved in polysaccharide export with SLBB domain
MRVFTVLCVLAVLSSAAWAAPKTDPSEDRSRASSDEEVEWGPARAPAKALSGPVDGSVYIVGPGDAFSVNLWGQEIATMSAVVTPEGELVLPGVATFQAAGKTLDAVKREVVDRLDRLYTDVDVTVSLTRLREIRVSVLGSVEEPGSYVATAFDPAGDLVSAAGGLTESGSRRNIVVRRRGGETARLDLDRYVNTGDLSANPPVLDGDVIVVPHRSERVHAFGAVAYPASYEFVDGETVGSLLELAGGFTPEAATDSLEFRRFVDVDLTVRLTLPLSDPATLARPLVAGDQLYVHELNELHRVEAVTVVGEVDRPGQYGINEDVDRLSDVLERAGGPTPEASLERARVVRRRGTDDEDPEFERLLETPVADMSELEYAYLKTRIRERETTVLADFRELLLDGDESQDVLLRHGDRIVVPRVKTTILVSGRVARPGHIDHVPGKRYAYYVKKAGGYLPDARKGHASVIRGDTGLRVPARRVAQLEPGDEVWIPEEPEGDWWQSLQEVVGFMGSIATVYLVISQASE